MHVYSYKKRYRLSKRSFDLCRDETIKPFFLLFPLVHDLIIRRHKTKHSLTDDRAESVDLYSPTQLEHKADILPMRLTSIKTIVLIR